jgi:peroxiredoxin
LRRAELFPPVVITIPAPVIPRSAKANESTALDSKEAAETSKVKKAPTEPELGDTPRDGRSRIVSGRPPVEVGSCKITVSEENITLLNSGGNHAVILSVDDGIDIEEIVGISSSSNDVVVKREPIEGIKARALFVIRAVSSKVGVYTISFQLPCGQKDIVVKVR